MASDKQMNSGVLSSPAPGSRGIDGEFVSLGDMFGYLWRGRWTIVAATLGLAAVAVVASLLVEEKYNASTLIMPVSEDAGAGGMGGLGALASQFGGLASLAGISIPGGERKAEYVAILQSEALTARFIEEKNLLPVLFADKWDPVTHDWKAGDSAKKQPTLWQAKQFFKKKVRRFSTDTQSGLSTLTISWADPVLAAKWANDLVAMANDYIREKTIRQSERNVEYLTGQLVKTDKVAVQNSISSLLENEFKKIMLSQGNAEYAFRVIDPASIPEKPAFPKPFIWTLLGCVAGFLISCVVVLVRAIARS